MKPKLVVLPASIILLAVLSSRAQEAAPLFNGKNLAGFYSFLSSAEKGQPKLGKNNDPEKVFKVEDGLLKVSGKVYGYLATEKEYENYHLVTEFRWGGKTYPPREKAARDSGILLHAVGEDGGAGVWMESIECQIIEGGTGDFILVGGKKRPGLTAEAEKRGNQTYYHPGSPPVTMTGGRINWFGRDPGWKDVLGFRGKQELERPVGEWNRLECICDTDKISNILNGQVVNVGTKSSHTKGKILFQSEGAEIHFRKIELRPLR